MMTVKLEAEDGVFSGLSNGDLVVVHVHKIEEGDMPLVYVDKMEMAVHSQAPRAAPPPHAIGFMQFQNRVRQFFLQQGFQEILTPSLVPCPGLEPSLEPFATEAWKGKIRHTVFLPTSPEIHLKRAMAEGYHDIFEIKTCFRGGEFSPHHENEFQMLEWYRGFADLDLIQSDLESLIEWVNGKKIDIIKTDFATLFRRFFNFELSPSTSVSELRALCQRLNIYFTAEDTFDDLFHRLLVDRLDREIAAMGPVIIRKFPPSQAALAKLDAEGWADRLEFYWNGLEIANAFNEVNDPEEQIRRWTKEQEERARIGTRPLPQDPALIRALSAGLPPSGGIALGLERLYMACAGVKNIKDLKFFSISNLFGP